jgi:hypothetical protein
MDKALSWFISGWVTFAALVNLVAIAGMYITHGLVGGWLQMTEVYSPFNLWNWASEVILLSPGIAAVYWKERRERARRPN